VKSVQQLLLCSPFSDVLLKLFINPDQFGGALFHQLLKMVAVSSILLSPLTLSDVAQEHNIFLSFRLNCCETVDSMMRKQWLLQELFTCWATSWRTLLKKRRVHSGDAH